MARRQARAQQKSLQQYDPWLRPDDAQQRIIRLLLTPETKFRHEAENWCEHHGVKDTQNADLFEFLPFLFRRLMQQWPNCPALTQIRIHYVQSVAKNVQQTRCWAPPISAFNREGISPLLLKGAAISVDYYEAASDRVLSDIDMHVVPQAQQRAHNTLTDCGWSEVRMKTNLRDIQFEHAAPYAHKDFAFGAVDLHVHVIYACHSTGIDQWFLDRAETFNYAGNDVSRLNPTAFLTHTVLHGMKWEATRSFRWIVDSALIIRRRGDDIDWDGIVQFGREHGFLHRLSLALIYLHENFQFDIPARIVDDMKRHTPNRLERFESKLLLEKPAFLCTGVESLKKLVFLIIWRAIRLNGGIRLPLDIWRVARHMVGNDPTANIAQRLASFGQPDAKR